MAEAAFAALAFAAWFVWFCWERTRRAARRQRWADGPATTPFRPRITAQEEQP